MNPLDELKGKVIVVTGAANGIGLETARLLKDLGAIVCGVDVSDDHLVREWLDSAYHCDVKSPQEILEVWDHIVDSQGTPHGLVNSAAISLSEWIEDITPEQYEDIWRVNMMGTFLMSQEFVKLQARGIVKHGHIVNLGSLGAVQGFRGGAGYVATKGAVRATTRQMGRELRGKFCVTCIEPETLLGPSKISDYIVDRLFETRQDEEQCERHNVGKVKSREEAQRYFRGVPKGTEQTCKDIARLACFCLTSWSRPLSGSCVQCLDGRS